MCIYVVMREKRQRFSNSDGIELHEVPMLGSLFFSVSSYPVHPKSESLRGAHQMLDQGRKST